MSEVNVVTDFSADPTGVNDCTTAFQNALNQVSASGGGIVWVPVGEYLFDGVLTIPEGVCLKGIAEGPFDGPWSPSSAAIAPTLLVTNAQSDFITLAGYSSKCGNLLFYYPNQVAVTASTPTAYPFTVKCAAACTGVFKSTFANSYKAIDVESGRTSLSDLLIGAYCNDIVIDHSMDWVEITNVKGQVMWDVLAGASFPQPIDAWVMTNGVFLRTYRVDSLQAMNVSCFGRLEGHQSIDSPDTSQSPTSGYGRLCNVDFDFVAYGIVNQSSNPSAFGFKYSNIDIGANSSGYGTAGQAAIYNQAGGAYTPCTLVSNGSLRGSWAGGAVVQSAGTIHQSNMVGP